MSTAAPPTPQSQDPAYRAESNLARIMGICTAVHALALAFVAARTYTRTILIKSFGADDALMLVATACATGGGMIGFAFQAKYGLGRHQDTLSVEDYTKFQQASFWQTIFAGGFALAFLRISIALSLLRFSVSKWFTTAIWATIVFVCLFSFAGILNFFLYCKPVAGFWDKSLKPYCYPIDLFIKMSVFNTACNILSDVVLASLPVPIVWRLQMKRRTRIYLIAILSLGYLAVGAGIVKAVYQIAYGSLKDKSFEQNIQFWSFMQLNLGIIAACAPPLKPLVGRLIGVSSSQSGSNLYYENRYGSSNVKNGTGALRSVGGTSMTGRRGGAVGGTGTSSSPNYLKQDYELGIYHGDGYTSDGKGDNGVRATAFYKHSSDRSDSEEMILQTHQDRHERHERHERHPSHDYRGGIMRTTEVRVEGARGPF